MKNVFRIVCAVVLLAGFASVASAADQTWTGQISDSGCGASHAKMIAGGKMTNAECTAACVKAGAKYVFVSGGKVYNISNQDYADLAADAGHRVSLTGSLDGDTITVSKMEAAAPRKPAA